MSLRKAIRDLSKRQFHARDDWGRGYSVRFHNEICVLGGLPESFACELQRDLNEALDRCRSKLQAEFEARQRAKNKGAGHEQTNLFSGQMDQR